MKKILLIKLLVISFILVCCSKNEPEVITPTPSTTNIGGSTNHVFSSKAEKYSSINETTGLAVNQNNFYRYIT